MTNKTSEETEQQKMRHEVIRDLKQRKGCTTKRMRNASSNRDRDTTGTEVIHSSGR